MPEPINILLLVEDDDNDIIITKRKLTKANLKVNELLVAKSLEETNSILSTNKNIDLILLDLNLPDSQGLGTLDKLRSVYDGIVIVLTSIEDELTGIQAVRQGADNYLVKNMITERILSDSIYYAIERKRRWHRVCQVHQTLDKLENMFPTS